MIPSGATDTEAGEHANWMRPLADATLDDRAELGGKAAVLGELLSMGMPVLPGVAISRGAYEAVVRAPALAALAGEFWTTEAPPRRQEVSAGIARRLQESALPQALAKSASAMLGNLGIGTDLIVRSSATAEDGQSRSFAGQFASVRASREATAIAEAIVAVWSSATASHVAEYLLRHESPQKPESVAMGVLIQPYERFEVAGILFSQHPTVRLKDWALVEFLDKSPDRIVSGEVTPHRVRLRMSDGSLLWEHRAESEAELTADAARALAAYAGGAANLLSSDIDMEWGCRDGEVTVLQARPATISPWKQ